ncbi:mRNA turnover protein 4 homolog [Coccinella septempunctata]|uniref:mRNA turnover protein 4 homolog n=1 Tax=Coccinella septempunctata TaxID=41139 RepID=UPI001D099633|nr:mRNA turnover protein 4 homolog [Coccinella septempunctata]
MPRSKRDKKISLTKTSKKGVALKQRIIDDIRSCVEKFENIYVFTFTNIRNNTFKEIRDSWKPSRFFFGKNRVIGVGLGRTVEEEVEDGLHKVSKCLKGERALLFTDCTKEEVLDWFKNHKYDEFARAGNIAPKSVVLEEGPLEQFSHAMEPYLRKLGLPTKLDKGVVTLIKSYEVCAEGCVLTSEQAKILELLDIRMATFQMCLKAHWSKKNGFEKL